MEVLGAQAVFDQGDAGRIQARLVDRDRGVVVTQVESASTHDGRGHPFGRGDEHELIGALDREASERPGHAGAEVEQHDFVEGGEERDELAVALGSHARGQLGVSRCAEHMEPRREAGHLAAHVGQQLRSRLDPVLGGS